MGDRMTQLSDGNLPFRLRIVEVVRQRQRAPDAVVDARASRQQRLRFWA